MVVVHWKAPDEALVSSTSVVGVEGDVIVMFLLHLTPLSAPALTAPPPLGCPAPSSDVISEVLFARTWSVKIIGKFK